MFTAYDSVLAPSSNQGARAAAPLSIPRSRVTALRPCSRTAVASGAGAATSHAVASAGAGGTAPGATAAPACMRCARMRHRWRRGRSTRGWMR